MPRSRLTTPRFIKVRAVLNVCLLLGAVFCFGSHGNAQGQTPNPGDVVFSQIYTRGGQPGSIYKNNFVELFNRSNNTVDISGQPFYVTSDTGQFNVGLVFIGGSNGILIPPGGYLLIVFETTGTSGGSLPFFDLIVPQFSPFSINLSPSGKIAFSIRGSSQAGNANC